MYHTPIHNVGSGSHEVGFSHPEVGSLVVHTGVERVAWGYTLNTANFPTYAGEVVQILSCFVEDIEISGVIQTYSDLETIYSYFLSYTQAATQGDPRTGQAPGVSSYNQKPMDFYYPHRGWTMQIMPKSIPGYRKGRDVVLPEWRVQAHVVDTSGDVEELKDLILAEAAIKAAVGSNEDDFNEQFGLEGKIKFVDENPFSDPDTPSGNAFNPTDIQKLGDFYSNLIPSYLKGDFDALTGGLGSKPAFSVSPPDSSLDTDAATEKKLATKISKRHKASGKK